ncbi:PepSY domain-containing protein [Vibrio nitrifigilis]|uniref:PepSY domain-containing protein n=1 Tax=Vibrio nitrifigilis TaxID=2789781 RepID=A0ABS0GBD4_9VIBR|nr:PepSY domain-containing protein [Vibrio nitrifigilis]
MPGHRHNHSRIGIWISLGLLFFSATGLTWSKWAGANMRPMASHHRLGNSYS